MRYSFKIIKKLSKGAQRQEMSNYDKQSPHERLTRSARRSRETAAPETRRRERPGSSPEAEGEEQTIPLRHWRRDRVSRTKGWYSFGFFPTSPQELQLWLQKGGWLFLVGGAFLLLLLFGTVIVNKRQNRLQNAQSTNFATPSPFVAEALPPSLPTPTGLPATPTIKPTFFVVVNTNGQGLFLRLEHSAESQPLETLVDGMRLEQIDYDFVGPTFAWRKVRTPTGKEGWVAADWLQPAH